MINDMNKHPAQIIIDSIKTESLLSRYKEALEECKRQRDLALSDCDEDWNWSKAIDDYNKELEIIINGIKPRTKSDE